MSRAFFFYLLCMLLGCKAPNKYPVILIDTQMGSFEVELYTDKAPITVAAFIKHVEQHIYDNGSFYRVLSEENQPMGAAEATLIQGGIWKKVKNNAWQLSTIAHEPTSKTGLLHKNGTISMAREAPGTASTEFFICIDDQPGFDEGGMNNADGKGYAAFGKVIKGMDVVRKIYKQPETNQRFTPTIPIHQIRIKK